MATEIKVPTLGESVTTATVARWMKQAGETVAADEPLVELETDKVTVEVNAPGAGRLGEILAPEGAEVAVGAVLATLSEGDGAAAPAKPPPEPAPAANPRAGVNPPPRPSGPVARPAMPGPLPAAAKIMDEQSVARSSSASAAARTGASPRATCWHS